MKQGSADLDVAVAAVLQKYEKELSHQLVLVAVSGGADSVSLLYTAASLSKKFNFHLRCIHVNHGLRSPEEVAEDAALVRNHCKVLKVPLTVVTISPGTIQSYAKGHKIGIEAAARNYRHRALQDQMKRWSAGWLFTGHTRDDALELGLMRFFRGSGPAGLAVLPERRGRLLRPLVQINRGDIETYLQTLNIPFRVDSTNVDNHYLRNNIRNIIIPVLDREVPFWRSGVLEACKTQRFVSEYITEFAVNTLKWNYTAAGGLKTFRTPHTAFFNQPLIIREETLFTIINRLKEVETFGNGFHLSPDGLRLKFRTVRRQSLRRFASGLAQNIELPDCRVFTDGRQVQIQAKTAGYSDTGFTTIIESPGKYALGAVSMLIQGVKAQDKTKWSISLPCLIRSPQSGDKVFYRGFYRNLATLRSLSHRVPWITQYVVEDNLGIAVYILSDIHSRVTCYWRDPPKQWMERQSGYILKIKSRGNYAQGSKK